MVAEAEGGRVIFFLLYLIECEIPSLKLPMELLLDTSALEERLVHLEMSSTEMP